MSFNSPQSKSQEEKWIIILGILATIILASILILFVYRLARRNNVVSNITSTKAVLSKIIGESQEYLPNVSELPSGFQLDETTSGPGNITNGNDYQLTYTNPDFLLEQRELNVFYTAAVFDSISPAEQAFDSLSNPSAYPQGGMSTTQESLSIEEFTNVDEVALLFGQEVSELGTKAINYILVFRFQNFIGNTIVSAPVDNFDDAYASQIRGRLRKAVIYYSSLIINKLPVRPLHVNIDNPVLPAVPLATKGSTSLGEAIFSDDFENSSVTANKWSSLGGTWLVENGVLRCVANGKYIANSLPHDNFKLQLDIMGTEVVDKIVVFHTVNDNQGYGIDFRSDPYNDLVLVKSQPGNIGQTLQTGSIQNYNNTWYKVSIIVMDNHIQVSVNGQIIIDYLDVSSPIKGGQIGIGAMLHDNPASAVYFDNVIVTNP